MKPLIISLPRIKILKSLQKGPKKPIDILNETRLPESTIFYNLAKLESEGLIKKERNGYLLTPKGEKILKKVLEELIRDSL